MAKKLSASFIQSPGDWKVHPKGNGRLVLQRDSIAAPLISPFWFPGILITAYLVFVGSIIYDLGWNGSIVLFVPLIAVILLSLFNKPPKYRPERIEFDKPAQRIRIRESDGEQIIERDLPYRDISFLHIQSPSVSHAGCATSICIITHDGIGSVCIEAVDGVCMIIYNEINKQLPPSIKRTDKHSIHRS